MCDKYFVVKYKVEQHQKIQTGDKTYQCCQSEKCFAWKGHLVIHDRTNTGDRLYQCNNVTNILPIKVRW